MVPALKTPRQQHALGGVLSKMRGEILRQGPGGGPSLYDPLTGDSRGGDVGPGAIRAMIETCADRKTGVGCRHVPLAIAGSGLPRRKARARPGKPAPSASVTHLALSRSCPSPAAAVAFPPVSGFGRCRLSTNERQTLTNP